jgi:hypothetical protein
MNLLHQKQQELGSRESRRQVDSWKREEGKRGGKSGGSQAGVDLAQN